MFVYNGAMGRTAGVTAEETRSRLLAAAADAFTERGYDGARVAEIASAAGLSNGALYGHYESKTDLLAAALQSRGPTALESVFPDAAHRTAADLLVALGTRLNVRDRSRGALITEALVAARRDDNVAAVITEHLAGRGEMLGELVRAGKAASEIDESVSEDALIRFCFMILLGSLLMAPLDLPPVEGWVELLQRMAGALGGTDTTTTTKDAR